MKTIKFQILGKQSFRKGVTAADPQGRTIKQEKTETRLTLEDLTTGSTAMLVVSYEDGKKYEVEGENSEITFTITSNITNSNGIAAKKEMVN